jgi:hypothetical protein
MAATGAADCCQRFLAEVIGCCKNHPGFALQEYLEAFRDLQCGEWHTVPGSATAYPWPAGELSNRTGTGDCQFMDLDLTCPR